MDRIWHYFQNEATDIFSGSHPRHRFLIRAVARRVSAPSLLNIGVGDGYLEQTAQALGWHVESIDPDRDATARLARLGIRATTGSIESLPYADASLDAVIASEVLEHLDAETCAAGVREIARVLKPGGFFLGTVPHAEDLRANNAVCPHCGTVFHRWGHRRAFTLGDVRSMLARFEIEVLRRTAFVELRGLRRFVKGTIRIMLARIGEPIANPSILWIAQRL